MSGRATAVVLLSTLAVLVCYAVVAKGDDGTVPARRVFGYGQIRFNGLGPERWAQRYRREHQRVLELRAAAQAERASLSRALRRQRRVLLQKPQVVEAVNLACAAYGFCSTLWRKARCETGGTFSARAHNASSGAAGLFQFLPSTWASTPYARFSVWSPYASALAAGWMHQAGRGGEWTCR